MKTNTKRKKQQQGNLGKATKGDERENRPKMKQKQEDEEKDATTEEKATQRGKTGKEKKRVSCSFRRRALSTPTKGTMGRTPQHCKDEARGGGKRRGARGTGTLRNQLKRNQLLEIASSSGSAEQELTTKENNNIQTTRERGERRRNYSALRKLSQEIPT